MVHVKWYFLYLLLQTFLKLDKLSRLDRFVMVFTSVKLYTSTVWVLRCINSHVLGLSL